MYQGHLVSSRSTLSCWQVRERVINVSSISSSSQMDWGNLEGEQRYSAEAQYETSKARDPDSQQC